MTRTLRRHAAARALVALTSIGLVASGVALAQAPAHASGIGAGRALIRIDAPSATVTKKADGSYRLVLPRGASGQWMGERKNERGKTVVRVGDLSAEQLSRKWGKFRYGTSSPLATLAWNSSTSRTTGSLIRMGRPKVTDQGVVIAFTKIAGLKIPGTLQEVSLNIRRGPEKSARDTVTNINLTADLWYHFNVEDEYNKTYGKIYNNTNGNDCWDATMTPSNDDVTIPDNTCDTIDYNGAAQTTFPGTDSTGGAGWLDVYLTPTDPAGDTMSWNQMVYNWYVGGSG
jgi:hypothetical protein